MSEVLTYNGVEITVTEANGSFVCAPTYEAHSAQRINEIIQATERLLTGTGRRMTFRTF